MYADDGLVSDIIAEIEKEMFHGYTKYEEFLPVGLGEKYRQLRKSLNDGFDKNSNQKIMSVLLEVKDALTGAYPIESADLSLNDDMMNEDLRGWF